MAKSKKENPAKTNGKELDLEVNREDGTDQYLTTNQGVRINDNQNSLKAGERGPSRLEDFILREKITHFDHERIPERVVHARGAAAHSYFQVYPSMAAVTKAKFLQDPSGGIVRQESVCVDYAQGRVGLRLCAAGVSLNIVVMEEF